MKINVFQESRLTAGLVLLAAICVLEPTFAMAQADGRVSQTETDENRETDLPANVAADVPRTVFHDRVEPAGSDETAAVPSGPPPGISAGEWPNTSDGPRRASIIPGLSGVRWHPAADKADESGALIPLGFRLTAEIEPLYVRPLNVVSGGRNDSNPVWSPSGRLIAFERSIGDKREIVVARRDGTPVQTIYCRRAESDGGMAFNFPGVIDDTSYNSALAWSPDEGRMVFMSNGGGGNYDLYLLPALGKEITIRLTEARERDGHPHWSPAGDRLVFVSGRSGSAEVYLMDLASGQIRKLTNGPKTFLYPQWSPDGTKIAMIHGSNENHDVFLIEDVQRPLETLTPVTTWEFDDLRPVWSPDGTKIAFYSNFDATGDPKTWSLLVVPAAGPRPFTRAGLAAAVVAENVIPDIERGPAWMPDGRRIVYVRNDEQAFNPIFVVDTVARVNRPINTGTKMNHDVVCAPDGALAFRAQSEQWDQIYIAELKPETSPPEPRQR